MARLAFRVGLSLLFASVAEKPLPGKFIASAVAGEDEPAILKRQELAASLEYMELQGRVCGDDPGNSGEMVPELLALADWPLDGASSPGKECMKEQGAMALADAALPPPIEIRANPVVRVLAAGMETTVAEVAPPADADRQNPFDGKLAALDTESLDGIRGGFEPPDSNLKFSFGIERVVYVNGQMVASTVLNVKDLQSLSGAGGVPMAVQGGTNGAFAVIQNGSGNIFSAQIGPDQAGTVVQNTLNDQHIQTVTVINAAVNSAQVLRTMLLQSAVQDGVVSSLRR